MGAYREYMREDYKEERTSIIVWLICALVAGFLIQNVLIRWLDGSAFVQSYLMLSTSGIAQLHVWTLLSYSFLHDPDNLLHILFSILCLYFIGREVLSALGTKKFLALYGVSALAGALLWLAFHFKSGAALYGASAAVSGLFFFFVCLFPDRPITFLLLFIPITLPKTKYLGYGIAIFDLFGLAFWEFGKNSFTAHSAHLGGMLAGLAFFAWVHRGVRFRFRNPFSKVERQAPAWVGKAGNNPSVRGDFRVNITNKDRLKAEVDRILDKINSRGFASLTTEEKRILDEAKDLLNKD